MSAIAYLICYNLEEPEVILGNFGMQYSSNRSFQSSYNLTPDLALSLLYFTRHCCVCKHAVQ